MAEYFAGLAFIGLALIFFFIPALPVAFIWVLINPVTIISQIVLLIVLILLYFVLLVVEFIAALVLAAVFTN